MKNKYFCPRCGNRGEPQCARCVKPKIDPTSPDWRDGYETGNAEGFDEGCNYERARIVTWLRNTPDSGWLKPIAEKAAELIEEGEHEEP